MSSADRCQESEYFDDSGEPSSCGMIASWMRIDPMDEENIYPVCEQHRGTLSNVIRIRED